MKCDTIEELDKFLIIQEQALGKTSPEVATTMTKLGELHFKAGNFTKAESLNQGALDIRKNLSGFHKSEIEESERNLERIRQAINPPVAETSVKQNTSEIQAPPPPKPVERARQNSGEIELLPTSPETVTGAHRKILANDAAREMELEVTLLKEMVGAEHPSVADSLTKLADLYCRARSYDKMEPVLLEALRIRENSVNPDQLKTSTELKNLAQLYLFQEKFLLAEPLFRRALTIREKLLGPSHKKVLDIQEQLVRVLKRTGRPAQVEELERKIASLKKNDDLSALSSDDGAGSRISL